MEKERPPKLQPYFMDHHLDLHEKMVSSCEQSLKLTKIKLREREMVISFEPEDGDPAEMQIWKKKVKEVFDKKEPLPFPSLYEIRKQHEIQHAEQIDKRRDAKKREQERNAALQRAEELAKTKARLLLEAEQAKSLKITFNRGVVEGEPIRTIHNYSGVNSSYGKNRTLVKKEPYFRDKKLPSAVPTWISQDHYGYPDAHPSLPRTDAYYQLAFKSTARNNKSRETVKREHFRQRKLDQQEKRLQYDEELKSARSPPKSSDSLQNPSVSRSGRYRKTMLLSSASGMSRSTGFFTTEGDTLAFVDSFDNQSLYSGKNLKLGNKDNQSVESCSLMSEDGEGDNSDDASSYQSRESAIARRLRRLEDLKRLGEGVGRGAVASDGVRVSHVPVEQTNTDSEGDDAPTATKNGSRVRTGSVLIDDHISSRMDPIARRSSVQTRFTVCSQDNVVAGASSISTVSRVLLSDGPRPTMHTAPPVGPFSSRKSTSAPKLLRPLGSQYPKKIPDNRNTMVASPNFSSSLASTLPARVGSQVSFSPPGPIGDNNKRPRGITMPVGRLIGSMPPNLSSPSFLTSESLLEEDENNNPDSIDDSEEKDEDDDTYNDASEKSDSDLVEKKQYISTSEGKSSKKKKHWQSTGKFCTFRRNLAAEETWDIPAELMLPAPYSEHNGLIIKMMKFDHGELQRHAFKPRPITYQAELDAYNARTTPDQFMERRHTVLADETDITTPKEEVLPTITESVTNEPLPAPSTESKTTSDSILQVHGLLPSDNSKLIENVSQSMSLPPVNSEENIVRSVIKPASLAHDDTNTENSPTTAQEFFTALITPHSVKELPSDNKNMEEIQDVKLDSNLTEIPPSSENCDEIPVTLPQLTLLAAKPTPPTFLNIQTPDNSNHAAVKDSATHNINQTDAITSNIVNNDTVVTVEKDHQQTDANSSRNENIEAPVDEEENSRASAVVSEIPIAPSNTNNIESDDIVPSHDKTDPLTAASTSTPIDQMIDITTAAVPSIKLPINHDNVSNDIGKQVVGGRRDSVGEESIQDSISHSDSMIERSLSVNELAPMTLDSSLDATKLDELVALKDTNKTRKPRPSYLRKPDIAVKQLSRMSQLNTARSTMSMGQNRRATRIGSPGSRMTMLVMDSNSPPMLPGQSPANKAPPSESNSLNGSPSGKKVVLPKVDSNNHPDKWDNIMKYTSNSVSQVLSEEDDNNVVGGIEVSSFRRTDFKMKRIKQLLKPYESPLDHEEISKTLGTIRQKQTKRDKEHKKRGFSPDRGKSPMTSIFSRPFRIDPPPITIQEFDRIAICVPFEYANSDEEKSHTSSPHRDDHSESESPQPGKSHLEILTEMKNEGGDSEGYFDERNALFFSKEEINRLDSPVRLRPGSDMGHHVQPVPGYMRITSASSPLLRISSGRNLLQHSMDSPKAFAVCSAHSTRFGRGDSVRSMAADSDGGHGHRSSPPASPSAPSSPMAAPAVSRVRSKSPGQYRTTNVVNSIDLTKYEELFSPDNADDKHNKISSGQAYDNISYTSENNTHEKADTFHFGMLESLATAEMSSMSVIRDRSFLSTPVCTAPLPLDDETLLNVNLEDDSDSDEQRKYVLGHSTSTNLKVGNPNTNSFTPLSSIDHKYRHPRRGKPAPVIYKAVDEWDKSNEIYHPTDRYPTRSKKIRLKRQAEIDAAKTAAQTHIDFTGLLLASNPVNPIDHADDFKIAEEYEKTSTKSYVKPSL